MSSPICPDCTTAPREPSRISNRSGKQLYARTCRSCRRGRAANRAAARQAAASVAPKVVNAGHYIAAFPWSTLLSQRVPCSSTGATPPLTIKAIGEALAQAERVAALQQQLDEATAEAERLTSALEEAAATVQAVTYEEAADLERLHDEIQKLRSKEARQATAIRENAAYVRELTQLRSVQALDLKKKSEALNRVHERLKTATQASDRLSREAGTANAQLQTLKQDCARARAVARALNTAHQGELATNRAAMAEAIEQIGAQREQLTTLQARLTRSATNQATNQQAITTLRREYDEIHAERRDLILAQKATRASMVALGLGGLVGWVLFVVYVLGFAP